MDRVHQNQDKDEESSFTEEMLPEISVDNVIFIIAKEAALKIEKTITGFENEAGSLYKQAQILGHGEK
jgi:hypothetical protein